MIRLLVVVVLFLLFYVSFPQIGVVNAQSSIIYIRADGRVEGSDKSVQLKYGTYTFTDNISISIKVQRNNFVLDGAGYTLKGNGEGPGISLSSNMTAPSRFIISNVTIKNLQILNFNRGIECSNSVNHTIIGCYIADCNIGISQPTNVLIQNNTISSPIFIDYTRSDNFITHNNMIKNNQERPLVDVFLAPQPTVYRNYWSDYKGTDSNLDGVGDTPYIINENNQDDYPLMEPVQLDFFPDYPKDDLTDRSTFYHGLIIMVIISSVIFGLYLIKNQRKQTSISSRSKIGNKIENITQFQFFSHKLIRAFLPQEYS